MADAKGCLKTSLIGCGALLALAALGAGIIALLAWNSLKDGGPVDQEVTPTAEQQFVVDDPAALTTRHPGRVVLNLGQGEFIIEPAAPGAGLSARASFDTAVHAITESYVVNPDSTWVYRLGFEQTMSGVQAAFRALMGGSTDASIHIYLPPDVPIELAVKMSQGGGEVELGGLWLRTADFAVRQGGFALSIDEPLREPVERLRLNTRMGGVQALFLGNASPRVLDVNCGLGGSEINLRGAWRNDCDARFAVKMGGIEVKVPRDMRIETGLPADGALEQAAPETPAYVLRARTEQSMGEIEIRR
jgi:hypothetical protein